MGLHRLLGFTTAVPDPEGLASFYAEAGIGGSPSGGYAGADGGARVRLDEGPFRRLLEVEIGCRDERDLDDIAGRLRAGGGEPTRSSGAVSLFEPTSHVTVTVRVAPEETAAPPTTVTVPNAPGSVVRRNERAPAVLQGARAPRHLGHLVIGCPDLAATRDLLVDGFGLKVSDEIPGVIGFLRCSTEHHNVALVESPVPLLQHYSWECDDVDHVGHLATALLRTDPGRQSWGLGRHFAGSNFYWYLRDPSGSFVEFYSDMDHIDDDDAWESLGRTPFEFEHIANSWGPDLPLEFLEPADLDDLTAAWS
jgi:hypothetical protein